MFYDAVANDHGLPQDPFKALVAPRPIGWISSLSADGIPNLAPFSYFNAMAQAPHYVAFGIGPPKDTLRNVEVTGEFAVNLATYDLREAMNATSAHVAAHVDEFELVGLTPVTGDLVRAPMVAEAPASMECRATRFVPVGTAPRGSVVVFGEVIRFHLRPGLVDGTRVDLDVLAPVGRLSGPGYTRTRDRFSMVRPD